VSAAFTIRPMRGEDVPQVVALQRRAFPPPFDEELLWQPEHLERHLEKFPTGQFVAELGGRIVGSCSNCIISEERWQAREDWDKTVGGPYIENHDPNGSTLFGLDISVDPDVRRMGVGRAFYGARYDLVRDLGLARYGTACRIPDYRRYSDERLGSDPKEYVRAVVRGEATDRVLTPLLRYDLRVAGVVRDFMPDYESGDAAAVLEWTPAGVSRK
jgi:ribosomal protein S18 acetylase RimI-like enzyme